MNWKKIVKYFSLALLILTLATLLILHYGINQIYGAHTEVVDGTDFAPGGANVCIHNVNVLASDGETFVGDQTVCLANGTIVSVDSTTEDNIVPGGIDGKGKFLIPGLIDSHVHLFKSPNDLLLYVANGVTEAREMIGEPRHLDWREEIREGRIGPDLFIASPRLGSFGALEGWMMKQTQGFNNVSTDAEAKSFVAEYAARGYDAVKIYSQLNEEAYAAVCKYADAAGLKVVGHLPWSTQLSDVYASAQSEIAHLEEVMNALRWEFGEFSTPEGARDFLDFVAMRSQEIAPELVKNEVALTTTLWLTQTFVRQKFELDAVLKEVELAYENPGISEWNEKIPGGLGWLPHVNRYALDPALSEEDREWRRVFWTTYGDACGVILRHFVEGGVTVMAGTDANLPPTVPGFSLHDELVAMRDAGMSDAAVLRTATSVPARWMGSEGGRVVASAKASLILLDANPLEDIANTRRINTVFLRGKTFDRATLDEMLAAVKRANDNSRTVSIEAF